MRYCKLKIVICGLVGSENIGELFISKSLSWIVKDVLQVNNITDSIEIKEIDLEGRNSCLREYSGFLDNRKKNYYGYKTSGYPFEVLYIILKKIMNSLKKTSSKNYINSVRHCMWKIGRNLEKRLNLFYDDKLKDCDFLIIDGAGLLEYSRNEYYEPLLTICNYAEKHNIPVVFNAIGQSGESDINDFRYKLLRKIFELNCVKYVSARDSVKIVKECAGDRFSVKLLADAAFYIDRVFNVKKDERSKTVGIGLIRGDALESYNVNFFERDWIELFCQIAIELDRRGKKFKFFTNGMKDDYELGKKIIKNLGLDETYLEKRPKDADSLINTIKSFEGLITCRMHSSIAAFTLGIPSIILSWNSKVNKYMNIIGYSDRAIGIEDFNAIHIVDEYERALLEGIDVEKQDLMKKKARESVEDYIPRFLP